MTWAVMAPLATTAFVRWTNRPRSTPWMIAPFSKFCDPMGRPAAKYGESSGSGTRVPVSGSVPRLSNR